MKKVLLLAVICLNACLGIPSNVSPVKDFEVQRYLGVWHEIARLDHSFERGLTQVTAEYSLKPDGSLRVVNRGYDPQKGIWREAVGRARFVGDPQVGRLKVSFFGPFYGAYNIIRLDQEDYSFAVVCGADKSYLWILARQPVMDDKLLAELIAEAQHLGFPVEQLICLEPQGLRACLSNSAAD